MRFLPSWGALTGSARGKEQLAGEGHVFLSLSGISPHTASGSKRKEMHWPRGGARPEPTGRRGKRLPLQIDLRSQENNQEQIETDRNSLRPRRPWPGRQQRAPTACRVLCFNPQMAL